MHAGIYTRSEPAPITVLVGDHVFRGESIIEVCSKHLLEEPTPPSACCDHPIPQALERLVLDCLEHKPDRRPQSARAFVERLLGIPVEAWQPRQDEAWWLERGSFVRDASRTTTSAGRTIQVDLGLRRNG
jgi:hypothetical protein